MKNTKTTKTGRDAKIPASIRGEIMAAYEALGGSSAFHEWAEAHKVIFYRDFMRLAPREIEAKLDVDGDIVIQRVKYR